MKCFLCLRGNVNDKGICDNQNCPRSKPLNPPKEEITDTQTTKQNKTTP